jgi:hypothetical protein
VEFDDFYMWHSLQTKTSLNLIPVSFLDLNWVEFFLTNLGSSGAGILREIQKMKQKTQMEKNEELALERELNQLLEITLKLECELEAAVSRN